jgi:hypothetical protein
LKRYSTQPGHRFPFGATFDSKGTNFSVWGRFATCVELLLYERSDSPNPFQVIELDPEVNKTFYAWHVYVEGLSPGTFYGWRLDGARDTRSIFLIVEDVPVYREIIKTEILRRFPTLRLGNPPAGKSVWRNSIKSFKEKGASIKATLSLKPMEMIYNLRVIFLIVFNWPAIPPKTFIQNTIFFS